MMKKSDLDKYLGSYVKIILSDGSEEFGLFRESGGFYELEKWPPEEEKRAFRASHVKVCKIFA